MVSPSLVNRSSPPPLPPRRITVKPKDAETGGRPRGPPGKYPSLRPTITVDRPSGILDWPNAHFFRVLAMSKCWMATGSFAEVRPQANRI